MVFLRHISKLFVTLPVMRWRLIPLPEDGLTLLITSHRWPGWGGSVRLCVLSQDTQLWSPEPCLRSLPTPSGRVGEMEREREIHALSPQLSVFFWSRPWHVSEGVCKLIPPWLQPDHPATVSLQLSARLQSEQPSWAQSISRTRADNDHKQLLFYDWKVESVWYRAI